MTTATWSYPWLVLSSLLFLGHVSGQSEIRCDITDNRGPKKFAPCAFPFIFRNKRYSQCTQDTDPDGFLWCSTKLDARGRHIAGSGEWGYCDQRCSDSLQTETFISTTTTTTTTSTTTKESLTLPTRSLEAEDTGQNGGRAPSCDSNSPGKGCGGLDVRCDITDQSGPRKSVPCQFPFVFKNVQYNSCTNVSDPAGRLWCSTKVDKDGQHVGGKGDWGYCDQRCVDEPIRQVVTTSTTTPPTPRPAVILPSSEPVVENPMVDGSALPNANDGTCGLSLNVGFVVGGEDAAPGKYPFIAALGYRVSRFATTLEYRCAGSLINRRYVLTAAHCHSSRNRIEEVVLGDHNLATDPDCPTCKPAQRFEITAADVIIPDEFDIKTITSNGYDLALVRLPRLAITANEDPDVAVLPICLAWSPAHRLPNKELVIIGWGRTTDDQSNFGDINEGGAFSNILQQLVLPEFPIEECKKFPLFNNISAEKNFCAGGVKGQDSCKGDSGGPLIARQKEFSPMYLKGIVSFGTIRCARGLPGVYTNLEYFMPWILKNLYP